MPTSAYPPFFEVVALTGRTVATAPLRLRRSFRARPRRHRRRARGGRPLGAALQSAQPDRPRVGHDELANAVLVERHGARVIADELHAPLVYAATRHVPYSTISDPPPASVTVTSASKAFNIAGLKCAQVVTTNRADARRWRDLGVFDRRGRRRSGSRHRWVRSTTVAAGCTISVHTSTATVTSCSTSSSEHLPGVTVGLPEATYLAWLDCSQLGLDDPARRFLDHAGVAVSEGRSSGRAASSTCA